jgi:hypothetical protein
MHGGLVNIFGKITYQVLFLIASMPTYGMDIGEQLRSAAMYGNLGEISRIVEGVPELQRRCFVNQKDDELGATALHYAVVYAGRRRDGAIRYLLKLGADVDCKDKGNWTPLLYATYFGYPGAVELLLEAGAQADLKYILKKTTLRRNDERIGFIVEYKIQKAVHSIAPRIGKILALSTDIRLAPKSPMSLLPQHLLKEIAALAAKAEVQERIQKEEEEAQAKEQDERFITRNKGNVPSKLCIALSLAAGTAATTLYSLWLLNRMLPGA